MKKLMNLKGASTLSTLEQKEIKGGITPTLIECQIGCAGLSNGARCFASGSPGNCACPGRCGTFGCIPF
ncbi:hypothetical protein [uncultured Dokdonia sp.]|uniref:hypothetical protein n=1 Tax=uncultured Dokdonia sp. TaxID=575653 RepID=UPI0026175FA9|nr:hypothetical protein [uncultured Dokdonia sp.]